MRHRRLTAWLGVAAVACGPSPCRAGDLLDEIVVTARKIPEDLATVPLSVQALSGARLESLDITSPYDLQFHVPGLVLNNRGMFGAGIALRGVSDEGGGTLAVAPHVNGVPLGRSNLALARLFDVERVEVVKGPQGTLYGRNSTGGAINVVTRAPAAEFGAGVEAAVGSFDTVRARAFVDLPTSRFAARFALTASGGDGFIRNTVDARRFAAEDYRAARAAFRVHAGDALAVDFMLQRVVDDGGATELWSPRPDFLPDRRDLRLTTVQLPNAFLETTDDLATLDVAWQLPRATLRSVTGYARNRTRSVDDCAGVPRLRDCERSVLPLRFAQWSQELRLESSAPRADWVVGAFFFDTDELERFRFEAPLLGTGPINDSRATSSETAYAVFGQTSRSLGERWRATGGLRFSRERHRVSRVGTGSADPRVPSIAAASNGDPSWRVGIEFRPAPHVLWFASVATGFKAGGVTTERLPTGAFDGYRSEHLTAWEAGINAASPDRGWTLRASAFRYDFDDMQVRATRIVANRVTTDIDNAAAARIEGLDVSGAIAASARLSLSGAFVWMPRRDFVRYVDSVSGALLNGNHVSRAPEWSGTAGLQYRVPVRGYGEIAVSLGYSFRSSFYFTKENDPLLAQRAYGLVDLAVRFDAAAGRWYAFASARNVLNRTYFDQILLQSSPGEPTRCEIGAGWRF